MKKKLLFFLVCLFGILNLHSQTVTLLDPNGDGGFENPTATFPANGWTDVQPGNSRQWKIGNTTKKSGNNSAYVGNNGNNNGSNKQSVQHFYRDITVPAVATNIALSFYLEMPTVDYKPNAPYSYDFVKIYTTSTSNTPSADTLPTTGYTEIFGYENPTLVDFNTQKTITLPNSLAGTTFRLVFTFNSDGVMPDANPAIDNISLTYSSVNDAGMSNASIPTCLGTQNVVATIKNYGTANLTSATINWSVNGTAQTPFSWTGNLATNATANVTLGTYNFSSGTNYTITATATQPNGVADEDTANDSFTTASFQTNIGTTDVNVTNTNSVVCKNAIQTLNATGGIVNNAIIFSENFNSGIGTFTETNNSYLLSLLPLSNPAWTNQPDGYTYTYALFSSVIFHSNDNSGFMLSNSNNFILGLLGTTATTLVSPVFSLVGGTSSKLNFYHHYRYSSGETAKVQISTNGGSTYTDLVTYTSTQGAETSFTLVTLDLSAYDGQSNLRIRFKYDASYNINNHWWAIDNVSVTANKQQITWSASPSSPNTIFTDLACAIPYVSGTFATTVYVKPNANTTYTATSTSGSCSSSDSVNFAMEAAVWNGAAWSLTQSSNRSIEFQGNYTSSGNIDACSCTVTSGNVIISSGHTLTLLDDIKVIGGSITFQNNANLMQTNPVSNTGNIIVKRSAKMKRLDYTYWGTPVASQNLKSFSPNTLSNRFYIYNESTDYFSAIDPVANNFINAKGYAIRAPNNYTTETTSDWTFTGVPNNGPQSIAVYKSANGYNLVSNPYPSSISFSALKTLNGTLLNYPVYFWTNSNHNPPQQGANYNQENYATYTAAGGTPSTNGTQTPTDIIPPGQGFIVTATTNGTLNFYNSIRRTSIGDFFNTKMVNPIVNRFWVNFKTPANNINQILIAYVDGATNNFETDYDATSFTNFSDKLYSILDDKELVIQGRNPNFSINDKIPLGASFFESGNYEISIHKKEGIFNSSQDIYLKDKLLNKTVRISVTPYQFYADTGNVTNRFEIIYVPETVLSTDENKTTGFFIYEYNENIVVENRNQKITEVQVFDASGRLLKTVKPNDNKVTFTKTNFQKGLLVFKLKTKDKATSKKFLLK